MKRLVLVLVYVLVLLAVVFGTSASEGLRLIRLTAVNKSGVDVFVSLTGDMFGQGYYLSLPVEYMCEAASTCYLTAGDRENPLEKVYTLPADMYRARVTYSNGTSSSVILKNFDLLHNAKIVFTDEPYLNTCDGWEVGDPYSKDCKLKYIQKVESWHYKFLPNGWRFTP